MQVKLSFHGNSEGERVRETETDRERRKYRAIVMWQVILNKTVKFKLMLFSDRILTI